MDTAPRPGSWARAGGFVGLVAAIDGDQLTLFDPGARRQQQVPLAAAQVVPAAAVRVTLTVDLPLPHGLDEASVRRWVALLADPVLRERAADAMTEAGLDHGAAAPQVAMDARALSDGLARCLCGATTPATAGIPVACDVCGRQAAPPVEPPA
jgi:hypothetical protein